MTDDSLLSRRQVWIFAVFLGLVCLPTTLANPVRVTAEPFAFEVRVTLSPRAAETLHRLDEGIVVSASYSGEARPSSREHADQIGRIALGSQTVEVPGNAATVPVNGSSVERGRLAWMRGPVLLNVNVYSARRSGPDNLLACDFFDGTLRSAVRRPAVLHCSLIAERAATRHRS